MKSLQHKNEISEVKFPRRRDHPREETFSKLTMSNKKPPQKQNSLKQRSESNENKNILFPRKENKQLKHVLDGLWCISKTEEYPRALEEAKKGIQSMTKIDQQTENSMLSFLEKQLSELGIELEQEKAKNKNISLEKIQLKNNVETLTKKINDLMAEVTNERNEKRKVEDHLENIKELYNRSTRDSAKIANELKQEQEKYRILTENVNSSANKNDREIYNLLNENKELRAKIEELEEETEDFKNKMVQREDFARKNEEEKMKHINELKMQTVNQNEARLEKLARVMQENAELSDKLLESESLRRRFMEKCGYQEKELKKTIEEKRDLENICNGLKKRINDLTVLKSSNNKILEEKIVKLTQNADLLKKENSNLKTKLKDKNKNQVTEVMEENCEVYEEVEAKPYLFGPYDKK